jgi:hypothetical protein
MQIQNPAVRYVRTPIAADYIGLSRRSLEKLRCIGGGPRFFKRGRSVLYAIADLDAWVQAGSQASTSDRPAATA